MIVSWCSRSAIRTPLLNSLPLRHPPPPVLTLVSISPLHSSQNLLPHLNHKFFSSVFGFFLIPCLDCHSSFTFLPNIYFGLAFSQVPRDCILSCRHGKRGSGGVFFTFKRGFVIILCMLYVRTFFFPLSYTAECSSVKIIHRCCRGGNVMLGGGC